MANVTTFIELDVSLLEEAKQMAREQGRSLDWVVEQAVREHLERHENRRLTEQLNAVYDGTIDPEDAAFLRAASWHLAQRLEDDEW